MDARIEDEDGDGLSPFFSTSPPPNYSNSFSDNNFTLSPPKPQSQSQPHDADDDLFADFHRATASNNGRPKKLSLEETSTPTSTSVFASQNYRNAPKVFDRFDDSSSSSDETDNFYNSDDRKGAVQKRLDNMMHYLDRQLCLTSSPPSADGTKPAQSEHKRPQSLPEFIARGGGAGMFKLPTRSAVDPGRPPSLELRPPPLRETQIGRFLRNIVCVDDRRKMWSGSECGLRVWDLKNMYVAAPAAKEEDEDEDDDLGELEGFEEEETAPFIESVRMPATLCVVGDDENRVVWSGHKDGKIRCWKMDGIASNSRNGFKEELSWQAHRGPVLSMVMTSYGKV